MSQTIGELSCPNCIIAALVVVSWHRDEWDGRLGESFVFRCVGCDDQFVTASKREILRQQLLPPAEKERDA